MIALLTAWASVLSVIAWCQRNWRILLGVFLLFAVVLLSYAGCRKWQAYKQAQTDAKLEEVDKAVQEGRISAGTQDTETPKKEAQNASKRSNEAIQNVNTARDSNSTDYDDSVESAKRKFCTVYPKDPRCIVQ
jgi:predicted negative regulator of RcsB-dependent stress response